MGGPSVGIASVDSWPGVSPGSVSCQVENVNQPLLLSTVGEADQDSSSDVGASVCVPADIGFIPSINYRSNFRQARLGQNTKDLTSCLFFEGTPVIPDSEDIKEDEKIVSCHGTEVEDALLLPGSPQGFEVKHDEGNPAAVVKASHFKSGNLAIAPVTVKDDDPEDRRDNKFEQTKRLTARAAGKRKDVERATAASGDDDHEGLQSLFKTIRQDRRDQYERMYGSLPKLDSSLSYIGETLLLQAEGSSDGSRNTSAESSVGGTGPGSTDSSPGQGLTVLRSRRPVLRHTEGDVGSFRLQTHAEKHRKITAAEEVLVDVNEPDMDMVRLSTAVPPIELVRSAKASKYRKASEPVSKTSSIDEQLLLSSKKRLPEDQLWQPSHKAPRSSRLSLPLNTTDAADSLQTPPLSKSTSSKQTGVPCGQSGDNYATDEQTSHPQPDSNRFRSPLTGLILDNSRLVDENAVLKEIHRDLGNKKGYQYERQMQNISSLFENRKKQQKAMKKLEQRDYENETLISEQRSEIDSIKLENEGLKKTITEQHGAIRQMEVRINDLQVNMTKQQSMIHNMEVQGRKLQTELEDQRHQTLKWHRGFEKLDTEAQNLKADNENSKDEIEKLKKEREQFRNLYKMQVKKTARVSERCKKAFDERVGELTEDVQQWEVKYWAATEENNKLENAKRYLQKRVKTLTERQKTSSTEDKLPDRMDKANLCLC